MQLMKIQDSILSPGEDDASLFPCTGGLRANGAFLSHGDQLQVPVDVGVISVCVLSAGPSVGTHGFPKPSEEANVRPLSHGINSLT